MEHKCIRQDSVGMVKIPLPLVTVVGDEGRIRTCCWHPLCTWLLLHHVFVSHNTNYCSAQPLTCVPEQFEITAGTVLSKGI